MNQEKRCRFHGGTLALDGFDSTASVPRCFQWVKGKWRCPALHHHEIQPWLQEQGIVNTIPRWKRLKLASADDRQPHDYDVNQAMAGYTITVKAGDGYAKDFESADVAWSSDYIIANQLNGVPLDDSWPLHLVGDGVTRADGSLSGASVGNIARIELTEFQTTQPIAHDATAGMRIRKPHQWLMSLSPPNQPSSYNR